MDRVGDFLGRLRVGVGNLWHWAFRGVVVVD